LRILIVGGAFGDCYPPASTPFVETVKRLKQRGINVDYIPVSGRSTSEDNSESIAARVEQEHPDVSGPLIATSTLVTLCGIIVRRLQE
jgi:hypothetical protein